MKNILILTFLLILPFKKSFSQLNNIETEDFNVVSFGIGTKYVLNHSVRCAHNALNFHRELFDYEPREKVLVKLFLSMSCNCAIRSWICNTCQQEASL